MPKEKKSEVEPRFKDKTMDELFWDAKGFKQCLWTMYEANKFKLLTEKQLEAAWEAFNQSEEFTMRKYSPAIDAMNETKKEKVETLEKSSDDANNILNAPNLKKLKRIWKKISIREGEFTEKEFTYLEKLKENRKNDLIKAKAD